MPLLPCQTNSKPAAPLYAPAGAGGGGGGGAQSTFAQIYLTPDTTASDGNINFCRPDGSVQAYFERGGCSDYENNPTTTSSIICGLKTSPTTIAWGTQIVGDLYVAGGLTSGVVPGSERATLLTADTNGLLYLGANGVSTASLLVSSINGAAPGGGVPPNISVSSMNVNSQGYIEMFQNPSNESGRIIGYGDVNNTSSLSLLVGFVPNYANKINGTDGLWCVENDATGANQTFADFGMGRAVILGNVAGLAKKPPVLDSDGNGNLQVNGVGDVTISTPFLFVPTALTTISSLSVSSINGAAPGGGGSAPFFSTLNQSPTVIDCDANTTVNLLNFSTIPGHLYQIQTQINIQGRGGQEGTLNDDVVQEVFNEIVLNTTQGSFISTANAAARDVGIGTCGMWRSNLNGTSLTINGTFSTTVQLGDVYLTDFGPV